MHKKGREFDVWIEEHLYGHQVYSISEDGESEYFWTNQGYQRLVPYYSSWHLGISWLLQELTQSSMRINLFYAAEHWNCELFEKGKRYRAIGIHPEIPMAVCLAVANAVNNGLRIPQG